MTHFYTGLDAARLCVVALLRPGTLLVASDAPLDEAALARAPAWLRWIVRRKRAHWERAVYLLTSVEPGGGTDGSDALVGVSITRLELESGEKEEEEAKPLEADGLTSSSSSSSSKEEEEAESETEGEGESDSQPVGVGTHLPSGVHGQERQRQRRQQRRVASGRFVSGTASSRSSSSESQGPDGHNHSLCGGSELTDTDAEDEDEEGAVAVGVADAGAGSNDEDTEDEDLVCSLMRTYVGGPVKPKKRVLVHLSEQLASSTECVEIPLDREGGGGGGGGEAAAVLDRALHGGVRVYVYHQGDRDTEEYMDEIIGEVTTEALANHADEVEERSPGAGGGAGGQGGRAASAGGGGDSVAAAMVPRVHVFKGHAKWSRSQLMNEIARGDWGLCLATPHDLTSGWKDTGAVFWKSLYDSGRPVFAEVEDA